MVQDGQNLKKLCKVEEASSKGPHTTDSFHMKGPEEANLYKQQGNECLPGAGERGEWPLAAKGDSFFLE